MLRWFNADTRRNALAIVSPGENEGRSFIAATSAVYSRLGERTLLIDADLRNPRSINYSSWGKGPLGMLAGRSGTQAIARISQLPGLCVLPCWARTTLSPGIDRTPRFC